MKLQKNCIIYNTFKAIVVETMPAIIKKPFQKASENQIRSIRYEENDC